MARLTDEQVEALRAMLELGVIAPGEVMRALDELLALRAENARLRYALIEAGDTAHSGFYVAQDDLQARQMFQAIGRITGRALVHESQEAHDHDGTTG